MVESRWLRWIGPGVVALGAVGFIASTTLGAAGRPWTPSACAGPPAESIAAARDAGALALADLRGAPWFRLDPQLDRDGVLRGQRLALGLEGAPDVRALDLAPESFAAGPFGRVILVGSDDGMVSRLQALDVAHGCAWAIGEEREVIRRATIDPTGAGIYEMRVDRVSRADLGIWLRPVDGGIPARRVLAPLVADARFGRTWSTEFAWDLAGGRLAVQSCGEAACRIRVVARDGRPAALDVPDLGALIALDGDLVVTYGTCRGLPCPVVATDLRTRARTTLAPDAGLAVVLATVDGARLVHETWSAAGRTLRSVTLDGRRSTEVGAIPDDLRLRPSPVQTADGAPMPSGWVLLTPDGRLPGDGVSGGQLLRHIPDGATVPLDEATR